VNKFAEPSVRIQTERGHTVVSTGPYGIVRHPLYSFSFPVFIGTSLALGSLWALVPAVIACLTLILRTHWEDQMLQAELPGYKEFAQRVRFKLLPGIW
jgi:protein-S-isoprenylcysteine O-methyltransferase Ste14